MPNILLAKRDGKWVADGYNPSDRPTFYKTEAALLNSLRSPIPKLIQDKVRALYPNETELIDPGEKGGYYGKLWCYCRDYIKKNKISSKDILKMLHDEGEIELFTVDEEELLKLITFAHFNVINSETR